jgi:heptose-I-phosphate ethanolaminephosphotransferase
MSPPSVLAHRLPPHLLAALVCTAALLFVIVLGHDARRAAQVAALALPPLAWLLWPIRSRVLRVLRAVTLGSWTVVYALDAGVRGYLAHAYEAAPNGSMIVLAIANTSFAEGAGHLAQSWPQMVPWVALATAVVGVVVAVLRADVRADPNSPVRAGPPVSGPVAPPVAPPVSAPVSAPIPAPIPARRAQAAPQAARRARLALVALLLPLFAAAHAIKPWRRQNPLAFWPGWARTVAAQRAAWADLQAWRDAVHARALQARPRLADDGPSTVVLVISDSVNRDNLGLYGYGRDTTPRLDALHRAIPDELVVFRQAWSVYAGTIPALRSILQVGDDDPSDTRHVLALARAAGYRTWWISTHDDLAIEQVHARFADTVHMASRTPGRASRTPDDAVLGPMRAALADPSPRKLVVLHMMGAHPHYRLRFPEGDNPFDDAPDAVARRMSHEGRSYWVRRARDQYDAALRHHDAVVAHTLESVKALRAKGGYVGWLYLSDHGQEVGHQIDHAGHSASTEAGYKIPAMVWQSRPRAPLHEDPEARPFRGDWAAWTIAHLLGLRWDGARPDRDALARDYRWEVPTFSGYAARHVPPS